MVRRLAHGFIVLLLLTPAAAWALGLGSVDTRSALNEPLEARIPVSGSTAELESLRVSLASSDAFQRVGLDRPFLLSRLTFDLVRDDGPQPYIRVTTDNPIREPFLAFLVEVRWDGGRLLREYTLLLDPPVHTPRERPRDPLVAEAPRETRAPAGEPTRQPGRVTAADERLDREAGEYGPVQRSETGWDIAMAVRPDASVSVYQTMVALVRANPDAFHEGNVNELLEGAVLRVPSRADIESLPVAEARREFSRQVRDWEARRARPAAEPVEEEIRIAAEPEEDPEARLQVVGAADDLGDDATASLTDEELEANSENVRRLQQELTAMRETEAELRSENEELRRMADELRQRVDALERTIDLPAPPPVAVPAEEGMPPLAEEEDLLAEPEVPEAPEEPAEASDEEAAAIVDDFRPISAGEGGTDEPIVADAEEPAPLQTASEPETFQPHAAAPWEDPRLLGLGAGALVLILLLLLMIRRRRQAQEDDEALLAAESVGETSVESGDDATGSVAASVAAAKAQAGVSAEQEHGHPLERAEALMTGGQFEQALAVLEDGVRNDPENKELRLKLLEIHTMNGDRGAFESEAQELYAMLNGTSDPVWERASELGRDIAPENPLFAPLDTEAAEPVADQELDLDLNTGEALETDEDAAQPRDLQSMMAGGDASTADFDEEFSDLDFGLDADDPDRTTADSQRAQPVSAERSYIRELGAGRALYAGEPDEGPDATGQTGEPGEINELAVDETADAGEDDDLTLDFELDDRSAGFDEPAAGQDDPDADTGQSWQNDEGFELDFDLSDQSDDFEDTGEKATPEVGAGSQTETADGQPADKGLLVPLRDADGEAGQESGEPDPAGETEAVRAPGSESSGTAVASMRGDDDGATGDSEDDGLFDLTDENSTKLDLARAYLDMGDAEGARGLLEEVIDEGNDDQKQQARTLVEKAG